MGGIFVIQTAKKYVGEGMIHWPTRTKHYSNADRISKVLLQHQPDEDTTAVN